MWFRSGDLPSHSRTLIFCPWTTSGRPSQWARSPVLLEHHCSVNGHHFWQLGIKNFDVFLCIDDFIWFYVKYRTRLFAEKHPQIIIFCGCFIVDTVNRVMYRMLAGLRTRLRWVPNWQNVLSNVRTSYSCRILFCNSPGSWLQQDMRWQDIEIVRWNWRSVQPTAFWSTEVHNPQRWHITAQSN